MNFVTDIYRAGIAYFHAKSASVGHKLAFLDQSRFIPLFVFIR